MKVLVRNNGITKNWTDISRVISLEEEKTTRDLDEGEAIVEAPDESALVSARPAMTVDRMMSLGASRYFSIPRQNYQFLEWLVSQGVWEPRFVKVRELPNCAKCTGLVPGVFVIHYKRRDIAVCPEHLEQFRSPIQAVYFKEKINNG